MDADQLQKLRALATAATPGPWRTSANAHAATDGAQWPAWVLAADPDGWADDMDERILAECEGSDAAYIAAVSPDVVLALLALLDRHGRSL